MVFKKRREIEFPEFPGKIDEDIIEKNISKSKIEQKNKLDDVSIKRLESDIKALNEAIRVIGKNISTLKEDVNVKERINDKYISRSEFERSLKMNTKPDKNIIRFHDKLEEYNAYIKKLGEVTNELTKRIDELTYYVKNHNVNHKQLREIKSMVLDHHSRIKDLMGDFRKRW